MARRQLHPQPRPHPRSLAVYFHWPFCESKCPYCDFNSHVRETVDAARWRRAYLAEIARAAAEIPDHEVTSIFFGGGTPSLMPPGLVADMITAVRAQWRVAEDVEITAEANPSSAEAALFEAFAGAGVNRLSIGVQSFDDDALRFLGRRHGADEARAAIEAAGNAFGRFSFDLIYGLPGQTAADWRRQLDEALARAGGHLSVYQLTIEPGTEFHRQRVAAAGEETAAALYDLTQEVLSDAGLPAYEISNHARPGAACRHNLAYWRGADYVGVGPGAHGRLKTGDGALAVHDIRPPEAWLEAVETAGAGTHRRTAIGPEERAREVVMMGLRLTDGLADADFRAATDMALFDFIDAEKLDPLVTGGFLDRAEDRLRATPDGLARLDAVLARLLV